MVDKSKPVIYDEVKICKKINKKIVEAKLAEILQKSMHVIREIALDDEKSGLDHWIAKIITVGVQHGDHQRLNFMFDRLIGKVTEVKEIRQVQPFAIESFAGDKTITLGMDEVKEDDT
jgi:hypothetical protein